MKHSSKTIHTVAEFVRSEGTGRIVRVTWNGVNHERRLFEIERRCRLFIFPRSHMKGPVAPNYVKEHRAARREWLKDAEKGVEGTWPYAQDVVLMHIFTPT